MPDLPAVAAAKALGRVLELNRSLTTLLLRGCNLDQPEPPEPPPAPPPAPETAEPSPEDEEQDTGGKGNPVAAEGEGEGEEGEAPPAPPPPPPPPPNLGELLGAAMAAALASALLLLDLRDNGFGDEGVGALAAGVKGCKALRALYLSGCCTGAAEAAVAKGVAEQGSIVLCDLVTSESSTEEDAALQVVLCANRYEHTLLWEALLDHFPPAAKAATAQAFSSLPGAVAGSSVLLAQVLRRLVPAAELAAMDSSAPGAKLPFGGFVQWVADLFAGSWDEAAGPGARFAHLMRALAAPTAAPSAGAAEGAAEPEWLTHAAKVLCEQRRRYFQPPKPKPRAPDDADELCGAAQATLWNMLAALDEAAAPPPAPEEEEAEAEEEAAAAEGGEDAATGEAEVAAAAEGEGEEVTAVEEAPPPAEPVDPVAQAEAALAPLLGAPTLASLVSSPEELLHPALPSDLYTTCAKDVLDKTYRIEMQATLRLEENATAPGKGAKPESTHLDISSRPTQRNYYDDWDFFLDETRPKPLTEWRYCLSWLCRGTKDETTTASCLARREMTLDGSGEDGSVTRSEVLLERPFSAGSVRLVLTSLDGGPFLVSGLQVTVHKDYIPGGPLLTWHDTEPFREAPPEPPAEAEGEEGAAE